MTIISDAYRRALVLKGKDRKRVKSNYAAFGGMHNYLEAFYGKDQGIDKPNSHNAAEGRATPQRNGGGRPGEKET